MTKQELLQYDKDHIWHPYTSATKPTECLLVDKAEGVYLHLDDGTKLIDGMSSWWSVIHGYNHPDLNKAIHSQLQDMSHVMFGGLTHQPAIELAKELLEIVPQGLEHIFYCDSGSVAVEVAMKMALQYWQSTGEGSKNQFVTIQKGYHGDTWHAMSVCDPHTGMHHIFNNKLSIQHFLPEPQSEFHGDFDLQEIERVEVFLKENHQSLAAFILEPIVQGAGGMRFYHPEYLTRLRKLCDTYNILLIADEIATGFGRSGKMFACEHSNISPDIMCIGKAITGGYMSFAATMCSKKVAVGISEGEAGVFMHGPTFMANPLACATALASLRLLKSKNYAIKNIETKLTEGLATLSDYPAVADVRILGAIGVVEMKQAVNMNSMRQMCTQQGIWLRPFGKLVYTMPPYIIKDEELDTLCRGIVTSIETLHANGTLF